jgi:hypothetical protein
MSTTTMLLATATTLASLAIGPVDAQPTATIPVPTGIKEPLITKFMSATDVIVAMVYLLGVVFVAAYSGWNQRKRARARGGGSSKSKALLAGEDEHANRAASEEYFLGGRSVIWLVSGCTLFSASLSIDSLIAVTGEAARTGIAVGAFEWVGCFIIIGQSSSLFLRERSFFVSWLAAHVACVCCSS